MGDADEKRLEEALKVDQDLHGGDPALALVVAEMDPQAKAKSRANVEACLDALRANVLKDDAPRTV